MKGEVDNSGRALLELDIRATPEANARPLTVWIDTAFTGELVIPRQAIEALGLKQSAAVLAGLADGTEVVLESYSCAIEWFGDIRVVEVIANDGQFPLLGVGLLRDRRVTIDCRSNGLAIE